MLRLDFLFKKYRNEARLCFQWGNNNILPFN